MKSPRRKSIRLRGYDYSQSGEYFVTICIRHRTCGLGDIVGGVMRLSEIGKIVDECWRRIPEHFKNTRVDIYQIMPNHIHGVVEIREQTGSAPNPRPTCRGVQLNAPTGNRFSEISPKKGTLGVILRTFKGAVTTELRKPGWCPYESMWQRDFYDHIIRSDLERFYFERYIQLNPLLCHFDFDNPAVHKTPIDDLRRMLKERHGLEECEILYLVNCEMNYREIEQ